MVVNLQNVTIFHIVGENVSKLILEANVRKVIGSSVDSHGDSSTFSGIVRIITTEELNISEGDYLIEGIVDEDYDLEILMSKYKVYYITKISDNHLSGLPHYRLELSE